MALGGGVDCELRGLRDTFGGPDRGPAEFHDDEHRFERTSATRQESARHPVINYSRFMDEWTVAAKGGAGPPAPRLAGPQDRDRRLSSALHVQLIRSTRTGTA